MDSDLRHVSCVAATVYSMEPEPSQAQPHPAPEEPVKSIEDDGKADSLAATDGITDEQWRSMMSVVLAIYDFREEE